MLKTHNIVIVATLLIFNFSALAQTTPDDVAIKSALNAENTTKPAVNKNNEFRIELLGRSFFYGISYDRMLNDEIAIGASFSYLMAALSPAIVDTKVQILSVPFFTNYYWRNDQHRILLTGGINALMFEVKTNLTNSLQAELNQAQAEGVIPNTIQLPELQLKGAGLIPIPQAGIGYEYKAKNGFLAGSNLYVMYLLGNFVPWLGFSIGAAF